jgi:DNA-binding protein HU-beta
MPRNPGPTPPPNPYESDKIKKRYAKRAIGQVTKSELVDRVADRAGLSKKDATAAVDAFLETVEDTLARGSEVSFSGFGKFSVSQRSARQGRNPATGEPIKIAASRAPRFSAGARLKKAVK